MPADIGLALVNEGVSMSVKAFDQSVPKKAELRRTSEYTRGLAGILELHRPEALNALDEEMILSLTNTLRKWASNESVSVVVFDFSRLPRGVSSGTDLFLLAQQSSWDVRGARKFLAAQYSLIDLIINYPKPVVSLTDGKLVGSGVGLAMAAHYRLATPSSAICFPETSVGLVPDNGSTWFLSRLPKNLGLWMAMTGQPVSGQIMHDAGLSTHCPDKAELEGIRESLCMSGLDGLQEASPPVRPSYHPDCNEMERYFSGQRMQDIFSLLQDGSEWAMRQAGILEEKSPLSLHVVLRQLRTGAILSEPREALRLEYRILSRLVCSPDFRKGIKAFFSHGTRQPTWQRVHLSRVTIDEAARYFTAPREGELKFFSSEVYRRK